MISSMTAFAHHKIALPWGALSWEMRSVNHRYLEINFKLPDAFKELEVILRERVRQQIKRGKLDCFLKIEIESSQFSNVEVNQQLVEKLILASKQIQAQIDDVMQIKGSISLLDILQWPGVVNVKELDLSENSQDVVQAFDTTVLQLIDTRQREGMKLGEAIRQRAARMSEVLETIQYRYPEVLTAQQKKLTTKIYELDLKLDRERLEQELVYLAQKTDIAEEIERFNVHLNEVQRVVQTGGLVGRRLDFLMQELNREANTMGSKSIDSVISQSAIELKVLIEQIREQVQNFE